MKKISKVSDLVWKILKKNNHFNHVFLLSGGGIMHLLDSLYKSKIKPVPMLHEQACSIASYAYSRTLNTTGVCLVTSGPGATNAITGVAAAFTDSVPMIVISGQVSKASSQKYFSLRQRGFQEINIIDCVKPITKYAKYLDNPKKIKYEIEKSLFIAKSGRPGPVWLDIPLDIQAAQINEKTLSSFNKNKFYLLNNPDPDNKEILKVIKNLNKAARPLLLLGHGVKLSGAKSISRKIINYLKIPTQTTWNSIDLVENNNAFYFGRANAYGPRYANFIIQNSDYILSIGARLGIQHTGYNISAFAREAKIDMVDLDIKESQKPGLKINKFINADAKKFLQKLYNKRKYIYNLNTKNKKWLNYCNQIKNKYKTYPDYKIIKNNKYVDPYYFFKILSDCLPEKALVPLGSSGTCFTVSGQVFEAKKNQIIFHAKGMASMGFGLPSAIGAAIALNKKAFTVIGDGGLQLNIQELQTIINQKLSIKIFILQNKGFHAIRVTQDNYFNKRYIGSSDKTGVDLPSIKKISIAYGLKYSKINNNKDLRKKIKNIINNNLAEIIEVFVDPNKHLEPKLGSFLNKNGKMTSAPLEDLSPLLNRQEFIKNMFIKTIS